MQIQSFKINPSCPKLKRIFYGELKRFLQTKTMVVETKWKTRWTMIGPCLASSRSEMTVKIVRNLMTMLKRSVPRSIVRMWAKITDDLFVKPAAQPSIDSILQQEYLKDPRTFDRDAATRRSKGRADLKAKTGAQNLLAMLF
jgi:hypothetical protein